MSSSSCPVKKAACKTMWIVTFVLAIVGALNWGLIGAFDFNLVETLLVSFPNAQKVVYILVGISAIFQVAAIIKCRCCSKSCNTSCNTDQK